MNTLASPRRKALMIDFRKDAATLRSALENCALRYSAGSKSYVAKPFHPTVTRIDLRYSLGAGTSTPWVALDLDTKSTDYDGDATHPLFDLLSFPEWGAAVRYLTDAER